MAFKQRFYIHYNIDSSENPRRLKFNSRNNAEKYILSLWNTFGKRIDFINFRANGNTRSLMLNDIQCNFNSSNDEV